MSIAQNFPAIVPSLSLDFANVKALDPRITFTRASTATYYGTRTAKAEENLLIRSQEFDTSPWSGTNVTVNQNTGDTTAPDGTSTAAKFTAVATTANHFRTQIPAATVNGATYTNSIYAKKGTHNFVQIYISNQFGAFANFDLDTGVVGTTGGIVGASIVDVGNGWYRCVMTWVASGTNRYGTIKIAQTASDAYAMNWAAAGTESLYVWAAQFEQRSTVTAYTPTTTQPITNYIPVLESAASGVARFDHNPTTFESLGLLIEEQRVNLLLRSEEFDDAVWAKGWSGGVTVTPNQAIGPDGLANLDLITSSGITGGLYQITNLTLNVAHTVSCFIRQGTSTLSRLFIFSPVAGTKAGVTFTWVDGVPSTSATQGSPTNIVFTNHGGGLYKLTFTFTSDSTTAAHWTIYIPDNTGAASLLNGYAGYVQLEAGAFATSYIPTVASQVTRAADAASMTGANFSSWFNNAEGSLYAEALTTAPMVGGANRFIATADNGTAQNTIALLTGNISTGTSGLFVNANNVDQAYILTGTKLISTGQKLSGAYQVNSFQVANSGAIGTQDNSGILPVVDRLRLGSYVTGAASTFLNGTIKKIAYYPVRIQNNQLQALTS